MYAEVFVTAGMVHAPSELFVRFGAAPLSTAAWPRCRGRSGSRNLGAPFACSGLAVVAAGAGTALYLSEGPSRWGRLRGHSRQRLACRGSGLGCGSVAMASPAHKVLCIGTPSLIVTRCKSGFQAPTMRASRRRGSLDVPFVSFEGLLLNDHLDDYYTNQLADVLEGLLEDGMGVIPTDTQHAYVANINSRQGIKRIYEVKGVAAGERKPLSLMFPSISMVSRYADISGLPRAWYRAMTQCLPGPYTFLLRATPEVPRVVIDQKGSRRASSWKRREVGIRVPDCGVVRYLTEKMNAPLLASSCSERTVNEDWNSQRQNLDFVVTGKDMQTVWEDIALEDRISTIIDLTMEEPVLVRQGLGDASMFVANSDI